jgi:hypothetical protein
VGLVKKHTGSFRGGILLIAGVLLLAAVLIAVGTRSAERRGGFGAGAAGSS